MPKRNELKSLEPRIDAHAASLPILKLPVRFPVTIVSTLLHGLFNGTITGQPARPEEGHYAATQLSYVAGLLATCPAEPVGAAYNAIQAFAEEDPNWSQVRELISYGNVCEIMPMVHRGYYRVDGNAFSGYDLEYSSAEFRDFEARDTLLSELASSFLFVPRRNQLANAFDRLASTLPVLDHGLSIELRRELMGFYDEYVFELPLVSDDGFLAATGVSLTQFRRFQVGMLAMAEFASELALALARAWRSRPSHKLEAEMLEWITLCWEETALLTVLAAMTRLDSSLIDKILDPLSIDYRGGAPDVRHVGDGYFPPALRLPRYLLLLPDVVRLSVDARNVLFALQRRDPKAFASLISGELEPQLIRTTIAMFRGFSIHAVPNVRWGSGEIDLLLFDSVHNTALAIQAKAPLPAHGSRMVDRLEGRIREGVAQVRRFRNLSQARKDEIISGALGRKLKDVLVEDMILCRSCFGTYESRRESKDIAFASLPALSGYLNDLEDSGGNLDLATLSLSVEAYLDRIIAAAKPRWTKNPVFAANFTLRVPTLYWDTYEMQGARLRAWKGRSTLPH